MYTFAMVMC